MQQSWYASWMNNHDHSFSEKGQKFMHCMNENSKRWGDCCLEVSKELLKETHDQVEALTQCESTQQAWQNWSASGSKWMGTFGKHQQMISQTWHDCCNNWKKFVQDQASSQPKKKEG